MNNSVNSIKITYVNHSTNQDLPKVFLFLKNEMPTFDALREGVAWRVLEGLRRESSATLTYSFETTVSTSRDGGIYRVSPQDFEVSKKYPDMISHFKPPMSREDIMQASHTPPEGEDLDQDNGLSAAEAGRPAPAARMYWALAADGQEDGAAVPEPDSLFELNLEGVTEVTVGLYGNAQEGYHFKVDSIR